MSPLSYSESEFRDPVHGFIVVSPWERQIIDHPVFQRLRRIRQLAWTDMVYPGAHHTRFEHSLGVMHVATRFYDSVVRRYRDFFLAELGYNDAGLERDRTVVRLAALLHDVGHSPYSHAGEEVMPVNPDSGKRYKHEAYSAALIRGPLRGVIEEHPLNENTHVTAAEVAGLLEGNPETGRTLFWKDLISGQLDADRADYLLRDSYHSGVNYGKYDLDRLAVTLAVQPDPESGTPTLAVEHGGWHAAEGLILARYMMFTQVYFHHTRRAFDLHYEQALSKLLHEENGDGCFPPPTSEKNLDDYLQWSDWKVNGLLAAGRGGLHGDAIRRRDHYRCAFQTGEVPGEDELNLARNIYDAFKSAGLEFSDDEATASWYKFAPGKDILIVGENGGSPAPLSKLSSAVRGLMTVRQVRLYVAPKDRVRAREIVREARETEEE